MSQSANNSHPNGDEVIYTPETGSIKLYNREVNEFLEKFEFICEYPERIISI